eukprot:3368298-Prymnesium_polylepis.1
MRRKRALKALARAPRRSWARAMIARPHGACERPRAAGARSVRWHPLPHSTQQRAAARRRGGGGWASGRSAAA